MDNLLNLFFDCFSDFSRKIRNFLFQAFTHLIADKPSYHDIFANLGNLRIDNICDGFIRILDKGLLQQAIVLIELLYPTVDHLVNDLFRLAFIERLRPQNLPLMLNNRGRHFRA